MNARIRTLPRLAAMTAALAGLAGCDIKTSDRDLVMLDPPAAVGKLNEGGTLFERARRGCWVDPRTAAEYEQGHVTGAINLPLVRMPEEAGARLAGHDLFIVYGNAFQDPIAKAGAKRLIELGFKDVYVMEGGLRAWEKDGYKVVTGSLPEGGNPAPEAPKAPSEGAEVPEQRVP